MTNRIWCGQRRLGRTNKAPKATTGRKIAPSFSNGQRAITEQHESAMQTMKSGLSFHDDCVFTMTARVDRFLPAGLAVGAALAEGENEGGDGQAQQAESAG